MMKPGILFGEHIKTERVRHRSYDDGPKQTLQMRSWLLPGVLAVTMLLLVGRLFWLQVIKGGDYVALADSNRIRTSIIHAPRGVVFDRNGLPLVYNIPGFRQVKKEGKATTSIHLSKEEALPLISKGDPSVEVDSLRQYPYKEATSHVLGYVGQLSADEVSTFPEYQPTDWVGKTGIERFYESQLRGQDGKRLSEVDALGKEVRALGQTDPIPGEDITLTLDARLQQAVFDATKDVEKGAVVASTPDGQILAMVSRPTFDANLFTLDETYKVSSTSSYSSIGSLLQDNQKQPLLNRVIGGVYPPGSTFKLVTAAAGLENNVIDERYRVTDTGVLKVGEFSYANWYFTEQGKKEEGDVDVIRALARSNDIFFYKLAEKIGVDRLSKTAQDFGVGKELGIPLGGEVSGLLPTKQWKKQTIKEEWYVGDTFHYGIGQGYLLTTPLQVNSWTEVFANGGTLYQPRLIKNATNNPINKNLLSEKTRNLVRQGMIDSCKKGGVAWPLFEFRLKAQDVGHTIDGKNFISVKASGSAEMVEIPVACKTGTAQHGGEDTLPHAWITLFAPAYKPEIVLTVLVEAKGQGSNEAGPIAKKILEAYFSKQK